MEKSSKEQRIFKEGDSPVYTIKYYRQYEAHWEAVYRDTHREVNTDVYVDEDFTKVAYREPTNEVNRVVTEADFER